MSDGARTILPPPPGALMVIRLLLVASWRRSRGRWRRQQHLMQQRTGRKATRSAGLGFAIIVIVMAMLHAGTAFLVRDALRTAERFDIERQGWVVAEPWFIDRVQGDAADGTAQGSMDRAFRQEAQRLSRLYGGDAPMIEARLRRSVEEYGPSRLLDFRRAAPGFRNLPRGAALPSLLGSLTLIIWFIMMVCQGEGLELDIQRRRHPIWEFLFSHPVPPGAIFLAEMLAPLASNPIYLTAPVFVGFCYGLVYGTEAGWIAAFAAGIPLLASAACAGRALEVAVTLRFPARSRGAMIGLMSWLGYVTFITLGACAITFGHVYAVAAPLLAPFAVARLPFLDMFLGLLPGGGFSFPLGLLCCWSFAAIVVSGSVLFSMWGAQKGLASPPARDAPSSRAGGSANFGGNALLRKEILWFSRDRSALVQAFLVPLTLAGFQLFNMRGVLAGAQHSWNALCGAGVVFGTYFLLVLGPRSLASEGAALWMTLTWPQGLEALLRAKAWLWTVIATAIILPVLIYAAVLFPGSAWKIGLAGIAWYFFARSMAAKTVTLATVTSESGEIQKVPRGRRWAAQLGLLTFAIGILTAQWNLAVVGVTYSIMTAAAMWQNFRARLPYLYDPWSEEMPKPPTLMHAMIAISVLVELGAALTGAGIVFFGAPRVAVARAIVYGVCAASVSVVLARFLAARGVRMRDIWIWRPAIGAGSGRFWGIARPGWRGLALSLVLGGAAGLGLAGVAAGYIVVVRMFPEGAALLDQARDQAAAIPYFRVSMVVMGVVIAPVAEEFLFRGLLYRALDREWGGWRAVLGSAAFFAIYHPALSWVPVALVGAANAVLFRGTGRLAPCVVAHMVYNAVVLG